MNLERKTFFFGLHIAIVALLVPLVSARAQSAKDQISAVTAQTREKQTDTKPEEKANDIDRLKSKLEQLQSLVEQQQRAIAEMQKRLDEVDGRTRAAVVTANAEAGRMPALPAVSVSPDVRAASFEVSQAPKRAPPASPAATQDKPAVVAGWDKNHAFLRSADGTFETQITGYGQLDFRGYQAGEHPPNTFLIRRARLAVEGKLARYFDYKLEGDFADTASTLLRDFYVNMHRIDEFQMRFGQFRVPISQEEIRTDSYQDFVERSMVNNLVPSRSPGFMISGAINKGDTSIINTAQFEYQVGLFNGKGLLANNNNGTPESAVRLRFAPWKNGKKFISKGFIIGGAFTQGRSLGGTSVRGQTESRSFSFFTPDTINGKYIRANGEMTWLLGPAVIRAEYDQTNQRRDNLGVAGRNLPGVVAKGYMAHITYLLTGEEKPEAGTTSPKNNLFGDGGGKQGFGAWELKFRYANLQVADGTPKSNRAESFYFGPNWYLNRFVRYMLDLGFERFKDPARSPRPGDSTFFVVLSRIQVAF
jgi:phosphate-selective porin OprO/OprP